MNRSIDVALLDANTRIVVLSASAGVTNILVALAGGLEPTERFSQLDALRQIQFNILERLRYPNVIRERLSACWKISRRWRKPPRSPPQPP